MKEKIQKRDLREACLAAAYKIIEEQGTAALSLRDVARQLGVSHQAPYRHFASRDHVLAEIIARTFEEFSDFLEAAPVNAEPHLALRQMGERYLNYAVAFPLKYQLMFSTPLPDLANHPDMMKKAQAAFELLHQVLIRQSQTKRSPKLHPKEDAMFIWSTLHGLSSILHSGALKTLQMSDEEKQAAIEKTFERISVAIGETSISKS